MYKKGLDKVEIDVLFITVNRSIKINAMTCNPDPIFCNSYVESY